MKTDWTPAQLDTIRAALRARTGKRLPNGTIRALSRQLRRNPGAVESKVRQIREELGYAKLTRYDPEARQNGAHYEPTLLDIGAECRAIRCEKGEWTDESIPYTESV